jgi:hypothetical protein
MMFLHYPPSVPNTPQETGPKGRGTFIERVFELAFTQQNPFRGLSRALRLVDFLTQSRDEGADGSFVDVEEGVDGEF